MRTKAGVEIDFIIERGRELIPIEVKWTDNPSRDDARHLHRFLDEQPKRARKGYIICRCERPRAIDERITALHWSSL